MGKKKVKKKAPVKAKTSKRKPARPAKTARKPTRTIAKKASKPKAKRAGASAPRQSWLDTAAQTPMIDHYARELGTFIESMADGRIDDSELKSQEHRLVALMKEIEPKLNDALHAKVTKLLCEVTAYDIMHMLHAMAQGGPHTFQG